MLRVLSRRSTRFPNRALPSLHPLLRTNNPSRSLTQTHRRPASHVTLIAQPDPVWSPPPPAAEFIARFTESSPAEIVTRFSEMCAAAHDELEFALEETKSGSEFAAADRAAAKAEVEKVWEALRAVRELGNAMVLDFEVLQRFGDQAEKLETRLLDLEVLAMTTNGPPDS